MDCVKQRHNREVLKERLRSESHFITVLFFLFSSLSNLEPHIYGSCLIMV